MLISNFHREQILKLFESSDIDGDSFFCDDNATDILNYNKIFKPFFSYEYGATKFILIPKDNTVPFVIKIPFKGSYCEYKEDEEDEEYEFCGAEHGLWDYCYEEMVRYEIAKEYKMEKYFMKVELLGTVRGYPIYIQKKCTVFLNSDEYSYPKDSLSIKNLTDKIFNKYNLFTKINSDWLIIFQSYYGEKKLVSFLKFITDNQWDDDLHSRNIGFSGNHPVLIDYGSYYD